LQPHLSSIPLDVKDRDKTITTISAAFAHNAKDRQPQLQQHLSAIPCNVKDHNTI